MAISHNLSVLIEQLERELDAIESLSNEAINLVRLPLSRFPDNAILIQFFAYLNNVLFFIENYRRRIQESVSLLSEAEITNEELQEIGEDLATMLGIVLETKTRVENIVNRLRNLS
jgi:hypothetical protein